MAIVNSYPQAVPTITDTLIGTKYVENQEPATKSFSIGDIVNLIDTTTVVYTGLESLDRNDLNSLYPNAMIGFKIQGIDPGLLTIYEKSTGSSWIAYPITLL